VASSLKKISAKALFGVGNRFLGPVTNFIFSPDFGANLVREVICCY